MEFGEAVRVCFGKYADFTGRATRPEFWWFALFTLLVGVGASILLAIGFRAGAGAAVFVAVVIALCYLALLLPYLAVMVRRLHDTSRSGWWWFISLIPFVGGIVLLVLLASVGTAGRNAYGPDPTSTARF
jgi:uncharacterized membrane protein YhaH (DUF805 family)